jgi:glycine/D-amino acid oxidase-like deaminating enzyme
MARSDRSDSRARIVVIGAGIIGASIAFYVSHRPVNLTVIDHAQPGAGASHHSFAWINASAGKEPSSYHDLNRRSLHMWDRFALRLHTDIGLHWGGELRWVCTAEEAAALRQEVRGQQSRGYACRLLHEREFRQLEPGIHTNTFAAGALSANDGLVDPPKVVQACLEQVQASGATVRSNTSVVGFVMGGNGTARTQIKAVRTTDGEIPCDVVVLAAGVGTTVLAAMVGIDIPQHDSPGVVVRTDPRPPLFKTISVLNTPLLEADRPGIHVRQGTDGTVMIGEGTQESLARNDSQAHADDLLARATHYLPALAGTRAIPVPVGYRPMPLDGLPILGFTQAVSNLYVALMHSGVTLAALVGEFSAIEIADGTNVDLLNSYRLERFSG